MKNELAHRMRPLKPGDTVRVIAPSSPFERAAFRDGIAVLRKWGLRVRYRQDVFALDRRRDYLAGDDGRRMAELAEALHDEATRAIFCARGGYGAGRLIPFLEDLPRPAPKILAGFSDVTVLELYAIKKWGWRVLYAPVIAGALRQLEDPVTAGSFHDALFGANPPPPLDLSGAVVIRPGRANGRLTGGCLTLVAGSLATPYEIETRGCILFLEDVDEKPYAVDRFLTHLKLAGKFKGCRGIVIGHLTGSVPFSRYVATVAGCLGDAEFPVVMGAPVGHKQRSFTLPLGVRVELDTRRKRLTFLDAAARAGSG